MNIKYDISVIVPGRNIEKLFPISIECLLKQDFSGAIEIILIDDGSDDNSGNIIDDYARENDNIKAIHIDHGGPGAARNAGIKQASGKWIMFVDGDDYVENDFCKIPFEIAEENDCDIVWFNYEYDPIDYRKVLSFEYDGIKQLTKEEAIEGCISSNGNVCWNKLYRTSLFKKFSFPEHRYYEDADLLYKVIDEAKSIYWVNKVLYHYRKTGKSITNTFSIKSLNDYFSCHYNQGEFIKNKYPDVYKKMAHFFVDMSIVYSARIRKEDADKDNYENCKRILNDKSLPSPNQLKKKILRFMFCHMNSIFNFLANLSGERNYSKEDSL